MDIKTRRRMFKDGRFIMPMDRPNIREHAEKLATARRALATKTTLATKESNKEELRRQILCTPYYRIYVESIDDATVDKILDYTNKLPGVVILTTSSNRELGQKAHMYSNTKEITLMDFRTNEKAGVKFMDYLSKTKKCKWDEY